MPYSSALALRDEPRVDVAHQHVARHDADPRVRERRDHVLDHAPVERRVGVHRDQVLAARHAHAEVRRGRAPGAAARGVVPDQANLAAPRVLGRDLVHPVLAGVIDDDDLEVRPVLVEQRRDRRLDRRRLVAPGDDDRDARPLAQERRARLAVDAWIVQALRERDEHERQVIARDLQEDQDRREQEQTIGRACACAAPRRRACRAPRSASAARPCRLSAQFEIAGLGRKDRRGGPEHDLHAHVRRELRAVSGLEVADDDRNHEAAGVRL